MIGKLGLKKGIAEIGFFEGDMIKKYGNREKFNKEFGCKEEISINNSRACVQVRYFVWDVKIGDIFIPYEKGKILGIGKVIGKYQWDEDRETHIRKVHWTEFKKPIEVHKNREIARIFKIPNTIRPLDDIKEKLILLLKRASDKHIKEILNLLHKNHQLIFYGPPGTGKTYNARKLAVYFIEREEGG